MSTCKELMQGSVVDRGHSKRETDQMKHLLVFQGGKWSVKLQLRDGSPDICHGKGVFTTESIRSQREPELLVTSCVSPLCGSGVLGLPLAMSRSRTVGMKG